MSECHIPFSGHCDLDLILRVIVSGAYLLYSLSRNSKFGVLMHLWMAKCLILFSGHCDLDLVSRISITSIFFEVGISNWCVDAWDG